MLNLQNLGAKVIALFNISDDGDEFPLEVEIEGERSYFPVDKPKIAFYVNKAPLSDSSRIYLGQKIQLSFKATMNNDPVNIKNWDWEIDPPFVSEFRIIGEDQGACEIIKGTTEKNPSVDLIVYSLDRHKKKMTFRLLYEYGGSSFKEEGEFSFLGPDIEAYGYRQLVPEIYPLTGTGGTTMRLGYHPQTAPTIPAGHLGLISAKNPTDTKYAFFYAQLVTLKFSRGFENAAEEFVDLTNWLDRGFPYLRPDLPEYLELSPGATVSKEKSFIDSPSFPFQEDPTLPEPLWYKSKSYFSVFIFARPDLPNWSYVPVLCYNWSWRADAERNGSAWSPVGGSFFPPSVVNLENVKEISLENTDASELGFPKWSKKLEKVLPWQKK